MRSFLYPFLAITLAVIGCSPAPERQSPYQRHFDNLQEAGAPIAIYRIFTENPNSAGGVDVGIGVSNLSDKTIKYLRFTAVAYNAVGDRVRGEISRSSSARLRATGPYGSGYTSALRWENTWYNSTVDCMILTSVQIDYMDGTSRSFTGRSQISRILVPFIDNDCSV